MSNKAGRVFEDLLLCGAIIAIVFHLNSHVTGINNKDAASDTIKVGPIDSVARDSLVTKFDMTKQRLAPKYNKVR